MKPFHFARRLAWPGVLIALIAALAAVFAPAWIIQPFRAQSQPGLELSYMLRNWSPAVTLAAAAAVLALTIWLWRNARLWWRKTALAVAVVLSLGSVWLARQNHFEWMFNPLPLAAYAKTGEAGFVADTDMVMAIEAGGEAVAYPIRQMAYHHIVQDTVGGTPVVVTY